MGYTSETTKHLRQCLWDRWDSKIRPQIKSKTFYRWHKTESWNVLQCSNENWMNFDLCARRFERFLYLFKGLQKVLLIELSDKTNWKFFPYSYFFLDILVSIIWISTNSGFCCSFVWFLSSYTKIARVKIKKELSFQNVRFIKMLFKNMKILPRGTLASSISVKRERRTKH